jgi:hypothetical protein
VTKAAKHEEYYDAHQTLNNKYPRKNHRLLIHFSQSRLRGNKKNQQKEKESSVLENDVTDFHQRNARLHVAPI